MSSAPADDAAMGAEARKHYEHGLALFQAKDYAAATRELEAGYAIEPRREFLFAEAQAKRLAGDCRGAVPLYQRFLATAPPTVQVNATHIALGRCAEQLASARAQPAAPPPVSPPPVPPAPPPPPAPAPWTHDRLGAALLGTGVVWLGVGVGFLAASHAPPADTATLTDYRRQWSTAESRLTVGTVGLVGGAALVAGGVGRYMFVRRRLSERLAIGVLPGGLVLGGRF